MQTMETLDQSDVCHVQFSSGQRIGLGFTALASFASGLTVLVFLVLVVRNLIRNMRTSSELTWRLVKTDIDVYFLSLLFADILQALGGIMNIKWTNDGQSICGRYCSVQGAIQQFGAPAVALSTLAIAIHTFFVIFFKWTPPRSRMLGLSVITTAWLFLTLMVALGWVIHRADTDTYYTPTPYWCWINAEYQDIRIAGEYAWLWFTVIVSVVLYVILFFRLRGNIFVNPDRWMSIKLRRSTQLYQDGEAFDERSAQAARMAQREARKMLWYPVCYIVIVVPMTAVRWRTFESHGHPPPFVVTALCTTIFKLSGVINVTLFTLTRPSLLSFRRHPTALLKSGGGHSPKLSSVVYTYSPPLPDVATAMFFGAGVRSEPEVEQKSPTRLITRIPSPTLRLDALRWEPEMAQTREDICDERAVVSGTLRQLPTAHVPDGTVPDINVRRGSVRGRRNSRHSLSTQPHECFTARPISHPPGLPRPPFTGDHAGAEDPDAQNEPEGRPRQPITACAPTLPLSNAGVGTNATLSADAARLHENALSVSTTRHSAIHQPAGAATISTARRLTWTQ